jgi:hypothetical protein
MFFGHAPRMAWFSNSESATLPAPTPPVDRCAEAQARVREVKAELDQINRDMLAFKTTNEIVTDSFGRLLRMRCSTIGGREVVESEWRSLLKRRDAAMNRWDQALREWSSLRMEQK